MVWGEHAARVCRHDLCGKDGRRLAPWEGKQEISLHRGCARVLRRPRRPACRTPARCTHRSHHLHRQHDRQMLRLPLRDRPGHLSQRILRARRPRRSRPPHLPRPLRAPRAHHQQTASPVPREARRSGCVPRRRCRGIAE